MLASLVDLPERVREWGNVQSFSRGIQDCNESWNDQVVGHIGLGFPTLFLRRSNYMFCKVGGHHGVGRKVAAKKL